MKITVAQLTKQRLQAMPTKERTLLLLLGHVLNEINVFEKLILAGINGSPQNRIADIVEAGQGLVILRTLVGKLHEANILIQKRVNADVALKTRYALSGQGDAAKALRRINKHFARSGELLAAVRNTVAFHSSDDDGLVAESFSTLAETSRGTSTSEGRGPTLFNDPKPMLGLGELSVAPIACGAPTVKQGPNLAPPVGTAHQRSLEKTEALPSSGRSVCRGRASAA